MKRNFLVALTATFVQFSFAQIDGMPAAEKQEKAPVFTVQKLIPATPVKNQSATGTCWCFSTTSLIESQALKNNLGTQDISEMYTVWHVYVEKARNYILRQGKAQFSEGALGHDMIRAIATYGAVPEAVYSGLKPGDKGHDHQKLSTDLKLYLDSMLKIRPLPLDWMDGYKNILNASLGAPPTEGYELNGKKSTPKVYASEVLKFNPKDYVNITSFTHHPFYEPFVLEVPDNFSNGAYYNLPLNEMVQLAKDALINGYSIMWDADVSNEGFQQNAGIAKEIEKNLRNRGGANGGGAEIKWNAETRQKLFESLTTQDDHLMHITGLEKADNGTPYFLVKNSWGEVGPAKGYIHVSEPYFAINTISLILPKAALSKALLDKLKIK